MTNPDIFNFKQYILESAELQSVDDKNVLDFLQSETTADLNREKIKRQLKRRFYPRRSVRERFFRVAHRRKTPEKMSSKIEFYVSPPREYSREGVGSEIKRGRAQVQGAITNRWEEVFEKDLAIIDLKNELYTMEEEFTAAITRLVFIFIPAFLLLFVLLMLK